MARQPLGRGLSALIGEDTAKVSVASPITPSEFDIDLIDTNPQQPRERFNETELEQLAASIRANGVVQPIVLRKAGDRYEIVAGERRWRASQKAGMRKIPAVVRDVPDEKLLELALIENIQRQELNPIEEANAYRRLIENIGLTQEALSERVGKERTVITTSMRLLKLPRDIQQLIAEGRLAAGHGRALLMTDDPKVQRTVANEAADRGLSVRETERLIKRGVKEKPENRQPTDTKDPNVKVAETRLMRRFGTSVKISNNKKGTGGKIEIEYYGVDDLNRIYDILMKDVNP
jgi:ParB family chromosome partitioning protein